MTKFLYLVVGYAIGILNYFFLDWAFNTQESFIEGRNSVLEEVVYEVRIAT